MAKVASGAADIGEILSVITDMDDGDHETWFERWRTLGERLQSIASQCAADGHMVSAADAHLRDSTYFGVALESANG